MALTANSFSKCSPNIGTNIRSCGTVTLCNLQPLTTDDLTDVYMKSDEFRVLDHLLQADIEIAQCGQTQMGLFDFMMANKAAITGEKIVPASGRRESGLLRIAPFILADQTSVINNEFWTFSGGNADGDNWEITVTSAADIPFDVRSFPTTGNYIVYLKGQSEGGSAIRTAYRVVTAVNNNDNTGTLVLSSLNENSALDPDKLENPVTGYLTRGGNNVDDFEKECNEMPAYLSPKEVPFWVKTARYSFCDSERYREYRGLALENPLFKKFYDLPETKRNTQLAMDFKKRMVQDIFWGKKLPGQNLGSYTTELQDIASADISEELGVDGGVCVGKRAEPEGIYEQLAECDRVVDLMGETLNLPALFEAFYNIIRVRATNNNMNKNIDVFTDTRTAEIINRAMWMYYSSKITDHNGDAILRATKSIDTVAKKAEFGFSFFSYLLDWPVGVTMNVITHWSFDDELAVAEASGVENTGRVLWVLDFSGIYPGVIASNRKQFTTGELETLAKINQDFACVMRTYTKRQTLNSLTYTVIVECPYANIILENFPADDDHIPSWEKNPAIQYPPVTTSSTTTPE